MAQTLLHKGIWKGKHFSIPSIVSSKVTNKPLFLGPKKGLLVISHSTVEAPVSERPREAP